MAKEVVIEFGIEAKADAAKRKLEGFKGSVEDLREILAEFGGTVKLIDGSTARVGLELQGFANGQVEVRGFRKEVDKTGDSFGETTKEIRKATKAQEGSVLSTRKALATYKQELSQLNKLDKAYEDKAKAVERATVALRRAQGVQVGSVADLRAVSAELRSEFENRRLSNQEREKAINTINALARAEREASGIQKGSISELQALQSEQQRLADTLTVGSEKQIQAANAAKILGNQIAQATPKTASFFTVLNRLATVQSGLIAVQSAISAVAGSVNQFVTRIKQVEAFNLALRNIGLSAVQASEYFAQATVGASKLGAPVEQVEKAYKRIVPALQDIGTSATDTTKFIEALTARTQVLGLTTEESGRLQEAFAQVLAKGKLQAEELTQQIAEVDGAFRTQFAAAIGVTSAELQELTKNGEITSAKFVEGVLKMENGVELLNQKVRTGTATIQQFQNLIRTIQTKTIEGIGKAIEPGIQALLRASAALAKFVQDLSKSQIGQLAVNVFNEVAEAIEKIINIAIAAGNALAKLVQPFALILNALSPVISEVIVLATVVGTATASVRAFTFIMNVAAGTSLKNFGKSVQLGAQALVAFGTGLKNLALGKAAVGFSDLARSTGLFVKALKVDAVLNFSRALKDLAKAKATATTVDAVADSVRRTGFSADALGTVLDLLPGKFRNISKAGRIGFNKGGIKLLDPKEFEKVRKAQGTTKALAMDLGLATDAAKKGSSGFAEFSKKATQVTNASKGMGVQALSGAAKFRTLAAGLAKSTLITAALSVAFEGVVQSVSGINEAQATATDAIKTTEATLNSLGIKVEETRGIWGDFLYALGQITGFNSISGVLDGIGKAVDFVFKPLRNFMSELGFTRNLERFGKLAEETSKKAREFGLKGLGDLSNIQNVTRENADKLISSYAALRDGYDATAGKVQELIVAEKAKQNPDEAEIERLGRQRDALLDRAAAFEIMRRRLEANIDKTKESTKANKEELSVVEKLNRASSRANEATELGATRLRADFQKEFNNGLITENELKLKNAVVDKETTKRLLQNEKDKLKQIRTTQAGALREIPKLQDAEMASMQEIADLEKTLAEQSTALRKAEIERIDEVISKAKELASVYQNTASNLSSALNDLSGASDEALEGIKDSISAELKESFVLTGDPRFLQESLNVQGRILNVQYTIARVKQQIEQRERQFQLEMQRIEIQRALLRARSGPDTAQSRKEISLLESQLGLINQQQQIVKATNKLEDFALESQFSKTQRILNSKRNMNDLPPIRIVDETSKEEAYALLGDIETNITGLAQRAGKAVGSNLKDGIEVMQDGVDQASQELANAGEQSKAFFGNVQGALEKTNREVKNLAGKNYGLDVDKEIAEMRDLKDAINSTGNDVTFLGQAFEGLKPGLESVVNLFGGIGGVAVTTLPKIEAVNEALKKTAGFMAGGGSGVDGVRATGGPVQSGGTYLVNDGGGREAFVDKFNNAKLLPAGRNIKWRAPSDGYVIPAEGTKTLIQNSKVNAKIAAVSAASRPGHLSASNSSGMSNAGNLIKQIGSIMSGEGGTQRITNHVTIQSQSPVMDASKIMANVTRFKASRRIFD